MRAWARRAMARTSEGGAGEFGAVARSQAMLLRRAGSSRASSASSRRRGRAWRRKPWFQMAV